MSDTNKQFHIHLGYPVIQSLEPVTKLIEHLPENNQHTGKAIAHLVSNYFASRANYKIQLMAEQDRRLREAIHYQTLKLKDYFEDHEKLKQQLEELRSANYKLQNELMQHRRT